MYELIQLTEHDYYIDCPAKIGLVVSGSGEAVLIDSGNDKDAGKKVMRIIQEKGWTVKAVLNTHSHADHTGGNRFLQEKTGCDIYASDLESVYAGNPVLEPVGLYGGLPFKSLRNKFLMAQESKVLPLTEEVLPQGMRLIPLPGHCFSMTGFLTADGTAYIADCVSSEETLEKYGIGYLWDPEASLNTLEVVKTLEAKRFVPSHAPVTENIVPLAELNIQAIQTVKERLKDWCVHPVTFDRLLKMVFDAYGLQMTAQQFVLIGSTVRSYLSSMVDHGEITFEFIENEMFWKTV
ncbi:MAG: MBL fold metallo-hydrolase [Eubacteriales bacterium]|nr:MBL fold metallo-hydrolase [Eubacteriales bacterium]